MRGPRQGLPGPSGSQPAACSLGPRGLAQSTLQSSAQAPLGTRGSSVNSPRWRGQGVERCSRGGLQDGLGQGVCMGPDSFLCHQHPARSDPKQHALAPRSGGCRSAGAGLCLEPLAHDSPSDDPCARFTRSSQVPLLKVPLVTQETCPRVRRSGRGQQQSSEEAGSRRNVTGVGTGAACPGGQ